MKNKINLLGIMLLTAMFSLFVVPNVYATLGTATVSGIANSKPMNGTVNISITTGLSDNFISANYTYIFSNDTQKMIYAGKLNGTGNISHFSALIDWNGNITDHESGSLRIALYPINLSTFNTTFTSIDVDNTNPTLTLNYPTGIADTMWGPSDDFEFTPTDLNIINCTLNSAGQIAIATSLTSGTKATISRTFSESNVSTYYMQCTDSTGHKVNSSSTTYQIVFGALGTQVQPITPVGGAAIPVQITEITAQLKGTAIPGTQITWIIIIIIGLAIILLWKPIISKLIR